MSGIVTGIRMYDTPCYEAAYALVIMEGNKIKGVIRKFHFKDEYDHAWRDLCIGVDIETVKNKEYGTHDTRR